MSKILALYTGSLMLRSMGITAIAGVCTWKVRNVAIRHAAWVAILGAILLLPLVDYLLPPAWVPSRIQQLAAEQPVTFRIDSAGPSAAPPILRPMAAIAAKSSSFDWWNVAAMLYALVALAMFIRLATGYRKVQKLRRTAGAITNSAWEGIVASHRTRWRMPVLLESASVRVPMTIGLVRPAVILPTDWKVWDDWKMRAVLLHELAHVRRADWSIAVIAATAKCAYWLNPISWFLERQLAQLAEQASDDAALSNTQNAPRYAEILLEFAVAAQNGGRLMKGGIAMAQPNMKARIERALGNPITGTGIVRIAGWGLMMFMAVPVIYSASALQVRSVPAPSPIPRYMAEFGRNPLSPEPAAGPQAAPTPTPAAVPQAQQNSTTPEAELQKQFQMELENQKLQQRYKLTEQTYEMLRKYNQAAAGPIPELQNSSDSLARAEVLKAEAARLEAQLEALQAQSATGQQSQANPPSPRSDALLDLPGNKDDLLAYLTQLASLRNANSFSVSFTGIQGRTISIKTSGQDFSFGCESCSFFVGESVVSNAASTPPGPGMIIRLSTDGNDLSVGCRATICSVNVEGESAGQVVMRELLSGASESFKASKLRSVVITGK